jgi:N-hydroxyarylamine O-acetyltransferase
MMPTAQRVDRRSDPQARPALGFDLDAYLARIGYAGERAPTLEVLSAVQLRHAETIAFENLNPLLGWDVRLDAASLQRKMVRGGRGGYCFEQNLLLRHALEALGFETTGLAARIMWDVPAGTVLPRGHMLLKVRVGGETYVADVGFGVLTPTAPLRLETGVEQPTPHEPFRLLEDGGEFVLEAKVRGVWKPLYRFDLQEQLLCDYEITNWYLSHHPASHFVNGLIAARPALGLRYALRDNVLAVHRTGGGTERRTLATVAELRAALEETFLLTLPDSPEVDLALGGIIARAGHGGVR